MAKAESIRKGLKVALLGGETLLGRELEEVLKDRASDVLVSPYAASGEGNFSDADGEAVYLEALGEAALSRGEVLVVAGTEEGANKGYQLAKSRTQRNYVIDATGYLEHQPEARIISPLLTEPTLDGNWLWEVAHPAATAIALVLTRLSQHAGVARMIAEIFEPASERGKKGAAELHQQTTGLLSFKTLEKTVFDTQASFNLLPQYGSEAKTKLLAVEHRIDRHLATLLGASLHPGVMPLPSLRLIQAPVFHGYSISFWVEFSNHVKASEAAEALASAQIEVRGEGEEPPNNVGVAGQSGLIVGDIREDPNNNKALWLWMVGDNLRLTADAIADILFALRNTNQ